MEWWIIGTLIIVYVVLLAVMYLMSARESRALTNYALLILLGKDTHATQRASLIELIRATECERRVSTWQEDSNSDNEGCDASI
jgi:hypothetical protein